MVDGDRRCVHGVEFVFEHHDANRGEAANDGSTDGFSERRIVHSGQLIDRRADAGLGLPQEFLGIHDGYRFDGQRTAERIGHHNDFFSDSRFFVLFCQLFSDRSCTSK